jgi:hypothetical protein
LAISAEKNEQHQGMDEEYQQTNEQNQQMSEEYKQINEQY